MNVLPVALTTQVMDQTEYCSDPSFVTLVFAAQHSTVLLKWVWPESKGFFSHVQMYFAESFLISCFTPGKCQSPEFK